MGIRVRTRQQRGFVGETDKTLVVVMRVKNEEERLEQGLESTRALGCPVILLDDGSTDRTPEIAYSFPWVEYHRQDEPQMNELRDRNKLLLWALDHRSKWILTLDGDEVLSKRAPEEILRSLGSVGKDVNILRLAIAFMWADKWHVDFPMGPFWHHRIVRTAARAMGGIIGTFMPVGLKPLPSGLHCGCIPQLNTLPNVENIQAWIKAYGYNNRADYERKFAFYNRYDPVLWSQTEIIERLDQRLIPWDEDSKPEPKLPDEAREYLRNKMHRQLKLWEAFVSEQKQVDTTKAVAGNVGYPNESETGAEAGSGKPRRGRPRLQRNELGEATARG